MNTEKLVEEIIDRGIQKYEHEDYEVVNGKMSWGEWNNWEPTEDDLPRIIESIKYWSGDALPRGDKKNWNKLQKEIANECYKKELICYELLGKSMRKSLTKNGLSKKPKLQKRK